MLYGVSYYPEQKDREDLEHDLELIIESGINTVRMGEFAWCRFEPKEGEYHFEWLDPVVERLGKAGIKTIVCTPTACPPAWMIEADPDILYKDNRGVKRPFGGRRHYCYNNERYRTYCAQITEQIALHYGQNPYVAGFQIDNELAQEVTGRCTCPVCTEKFRNWLNKKYGTIEELNARTGGVFWSQEYTSFSQINPPVNPIEVDAAVQINSFFENPSIRLDFERFCSDSLTEFQNIQTFLLKEHTKYPVTTNATGLATNSINYYKSTKELDCYGFDFYPGLRDAAINSFPYAFARGVKEGKPFWVMEFVSGGGHRLYGSGRKQPNPGALKQAVIQSFAHGAQMLLHFQFRSFPFGAEQLNYAIVDLDGVKRRRYYEMQETASLLCKLEPLSAAEFGNEAAICLDYDTYWALRIKPVNDPVFSYLTYCNKWYDCLMEKGINSDVISYEQDFSRYKLIILPTGFVLTKKIQDKLRNYVENGGTLVATFLTSVKNEDNIGYTQTLPAGLTEVFAVNIEEVEPVFRDNKTGLSYQDGKASFDTEDDLWSELLSGSAKMLADYRDDYKAGQGVISMNRFGKGRAYYIGTDLLKEYMAVVLNSMAENAGLTKNVIIGDDKFDIVRRRLGKKDIYFIMNFNSCESEIVLPEHARDYLTGEILQGVRKVERNGFLIVTVDLSQ